MRSGRRQLGRALESEPERAAAARWAETTVGPAVRSPPGLCAQPLRAALGRTPPACLLFLCTSDVLSSCYSIPSLTPTPTLTPFSVFPMTSDA
ncbi:Inverted Formin-2 [Manis pentadactyla]|nr:Inverted Formin-2 [Manis pentadactyla]